MPDTWVTDIRHFLDESGNLAQESEVSLRFAEFQVAIIALISHPEPVPEQLRVACRRRPDRKPCQGHIEGHIDPDLKVIAWWCPVCGDNGFISNWQDTLWDLRGAGDTLH
jgi:hypothetical protein